MPPPYQISQNDHKSINTIVTTSAIFRQLILFLKKAKCLPGTGNHSEICVTNILTINCYVSIIILTHIYIYIYTHTHTYTLQIRTTSYSSKPIKGWSLQRNKVVFSFEIFSWKIENEWAMQCIFLLHNFYWLLMVTDKQMLVSMVTCWSFIVYKHILPFISKFFYQAESSWPWMDCDELSNTHTQITLWDMFHDVFNECWLSLTLIVLQGLLLPIFLTNPASQSLLS